jgi:hypothetical protein
MSTQLQYMTERVDEKMGMLLLNYIRPLLRDEQPVLIRARACQMIASYHYLELP